jgi:transposase
LVEGQPGPFHAHTGASLMIDYHRFCQIKDLYVQQGRTASQIANALSLDPRTVSYWLAQEPFRPRKPANRPSKLDPFRGYIEYYLSEDRLVPTTVVYQRLLKLGFDGKRRIVKNYLRTRREHSSLQAHCINYPSPRTRQTAEEVQEIGYIWVRKLIQGRGSKTELEKRFADKVNVQDISTLHAVILNKPLKYRKRAMTILLHLDNIAQHAISKFLFLHQHTVRNYIDLYKTRGLDILFAQRRKEVEKHKEPQYKEALFKILHAPPSCYDINRTTWKMPDLQRIMAEEGHGLCKNNIRKIIKDAGYTLRKAKKVLTSNDPNYQMKLEKITHILAHLGPKEKFFSIDEFGPFAVKIQGGKSLVAPGAVKIVPQYQKSKGSLICTAALELSTNQVTHFYSEKKNTKEMVKLLEILIKEYAHEDRIYFSWDAASWHASKALYKKVEEINRHASGKDQKSPIVELVPLPSRAQFLNVIESIFSGMARAIIHNSDYQSVEECKQAIDRYFAERNHYFKENPKRAGNKIWGKERVATTFSESNNCKDPTFRSL